MRPVALRQTGEYDAHTDVAVDGDGRFRVELGGYVTARPREGRLTGRQRAALARLAEAVDWDAAHPDKGAFQTTLSVGDAAVRWAGPPPTPALAALVGALVSLGA